MEVQSKSICCERFAEGGQLLGIHGKKNEAREKWLTHVRETRSRTKWTRNKRLFELQIDEELLFAEHICADFIWIEKFTLNIYKYRHTTVVGGYKDFMTTERDICQLLWRNLAAIRRLHSF